MQGDRQVVKATTNCQDETAGEQGDGGQGEWGHPEVLRLREAGRGAAPKEKREKEGFPGVDLGQDGDRLTPLPTQAPRLAASPEPIGPQPTQSPSPAPWSQGVGTQEMETAFIRGAAHSVNCAKCQLVIRKCGAVAVQ